MATQPHNAAITDLLPDTIIELYEVELSGSDGIKRFHPGKIVDKDIILSEEAPDGTLVPHTFHSIPFEVDGFESRGDGQLPRPKLVVANPKGVITDLIKRRDDLVGRQFKRIRIFLKFIDAVNFPDSINPFATSSPTSRFDDDIYVFNRKVTENKFFVEFELISPLEVENYKLPARIMIANYCPWTYRGIGCKYGQRGDMNGPMVLNKASKNYFIQGNKDSNDDPLDANLGVPVADENDKEFAGAGGYGLGQEMWNYDYDENSFITVTVDQTGPTPADGDASVTVEALSAQITKGRTVKFDDGSLMRLSSTADKDATTLSSASINYGPAGTNVNLVNYGGLITPTAGGTLADGTDGSVGYVKGDFVRVKPNKPSALDKPEGGTVDAVGPPNRFFICIQDHFSAQDPRYKTEYWVEDQCGKTLHSCRLRFGQFAEANGLPFGGFPSIEAYRYTR